MADPITIDNIGQSAFTSAATVSWTHNTGSCPNQTNTVLIAACGEDAETITGVTASGATMTSAKNFTSTETCLIYYSTSIAANTAYSMVATWGGTVDSWCGSISLCNVSVPNPVGNTSDSQATSANPSLAVTVASSGSFIVSDGFNNGTSLIVGPQPYAFGILNNYNSGGPSTFMSQYNVSMIAGSQTLSYNMPTSAAWTQCIAEFKAVSGTPIVTTQGVTSITPTTATGNGTILAAGSSSISASGICYATHVNPTTSDTCVSGSNSTTAFTASLTGLTPGTGYHVDAYATNTSGTTYGIDTSFLTPIASNQWTFQGTGGQMTFTGTGGSTSVF
jgi:hypothetical protein